MFTMHEALVRARLPQQAPSEQEAEQQRQVRHVVAARRWRRVERLAQRASVRHEHAVEDATS